MLVLFDSTVLIDYLRGREVVRRVEALERSSDVPATTGINVEEVARGLRPGEVAAARLLFRGLEILPLGQEVAWRAGTWRREFAASGITLSQADCLVAAAAWMSGAVLATGYPRHFPMEGVAVQHWPSGV